MVCWLENHGCPHQFECVFDVCMHVKVCKCKAICQSRVEYFVHFLISVRQIFLSVSLELTVEMDLTGYAGTKCVDQAGLQYRDLPDFACQVLGLRACTNATRIGVVFV